VNFESKVDVVFFELIEDGCEAFSEVVESRLEVFLRGGGEGLTDEVTRDGVTGEVVFLKESPLVGEVGIAV